MELDKNIFRSYDIRGIVGESISNQFAEILGKAIGSYIQEVEEDTIIVGHDCRESSDGLNQSLVKGLMSTGVKIIDIGLATTPMVYYARRFFNIGPAVQITASHNPSEYNGFKICIKLQEESIYGEKIQEIYEYAKRGEFKTGRGEYKKREITKEYINNIVEKNVLGDRKLKVVIDCANATPAIVSVKAIEKMGVEVIPLYCELDARFPNHHPDPSIEKNLEDLAKTVIENKADFGIGFDGDGDRIGIVDEKGKAIFGDIYMAIMWKEVIKNNPNANALVEVKCSQKLWDELEKLGAKPQFIRTGNPYIKAAMKKNNVPFSGEMSGHIFYRDEYYGFDDALYAAARFIRMLSNTNVKVSELLSDSKEYIVTPEITKDVPDNEKFELVQKAIEYFKERGYNVVDVDGARVIFENGWGLVRASNTSPKITFRFEADSVNNLEKIKKKFDDMFNNIMQKY